MRGMGALQQLSFIWDCPPGKPRPWTRVLPYRVWCGVALCTTPPEWLHDYVLSLAQVLLERLRVTLGTYRGLARSGAGSVRPWAPTDVAHGRHGVGRISSRPLDILIAWGVGVPCLRSCWSDSFVGWGRRRLACTDVRSIVPALSGIRLGR